MPESYVQDTKEDIISLLKEGDKVGLTALVDELSSKEMVHLMGHLNFDRQMELLKMLSPEDAAEIVEELPESQAVDLFEEMESEDAAAILHEMDSDDQADIIQEMDQADAEAILDSMDPKDAEDVRSLMSYDYDIAGGLMMKEYIVFQQNDTVQVVINDFKINREIYSDYHLKYIFVTDHEGVLKGVLQLQDLLLSSSSQELSEILLEDVLYVHHFTPLDELIVFFDDYNLFGAPVVDDDKKLIGIILRRDILEAENERVTVEHLESQGIVGGDELRSMPVWDRAKNRLSWLSVNVLLNILAASVIAYHQDVLTSVIALAVFLPIISDMSGCSGNQAVAVSMRELSLGAVKPSEILRVWWQEVSVGLINGTVLGILIGVAAYLWKGNFYLGLVAGGALMINTVAAVSIGGTIPLILKSRGVDPALASGPILTTITDMLGFFLALTFASLMMSHIVGL
jgi:magnesium transporter